MEPKIIGYGMTKSEKDKEDIELIFGTLEEKKKAAKKMRRAAYYRLHRDKELEANRVWRAGNRERINARQAVYRAKNKERIAAYRHWYYNNYERGHRASDKLNDMNKKFAKAMMAAPECPK